MSYDFNSGGIWQHLSTTQATAFGAAMAARYPQSSYPNVFWFFGDDDFGDNDSYWSAMLSGITSAGDTRGVISNEQNSETNSQIEFDNGTSYGTFGAANATYNWVYTYSPPYLGVEDSYTESDGFTKIPVVWGDGTYYGDTDNSTPDYTIRRFTWWALASGARGVNNTSGPSDLSGSGLFKWPSAAITDLTSDPNGPWITTKAPVLISWFTSLADWQKLIPDTGNVFITAGRGTREQVPALAAQRTMATPPTMWPGPSRRRGHWRSFTAVSVFPSPSISPRWLPGTQRPGLILFPWQRRRPPPGQRTTRRRWGTTAEATRTGRWS